VAEAVAEANAFTRSSEEATRCVRISELGLAERVSWVSTEVEHPSRLPKERSSRASPVIRRRESSDGDDRRAGT
jgi:hypothetical protein